MHHPNTSELPVSPITGGETELVDRLSCAVLVERYAKEWGLDVASSYLGLETIAMYRCKGTGYRFFHPPELAGEERIYDTMGSAEFVAKHGAAPEWKQDWQFGLELIEPGERILDVGCSSGGFLVRASAKAKAQGLEANAGGAAAARAKGLNVETGMTEEFAKSNREAFDKVFAFQVLEHVYPVRKFVGELMELTRPGGRIVLAVPNCDPYIGIWDKYDPLNNPPHHIGWWNAGSLRALGIAMKLEVEQIALVGPGAGWKLRIYRRACSMAGVTSGFGQHSSSDKLLICAAAPFALAIEAFGRKRHAGDVVAVFRKRSGAG